MGVAGVGWAATVSLPFAIMSQKVDQARMGLYMGLFNLSVVLPQLVASLGIGEVVSRADLTTGAAIGRPRAAFSFVSLLSCWV